MRHRAKFFLLVSCVFLVLGGVATPVLADEPRPTATPVITTGDSGDTIKSDISVTGIVTDTATVNLDARAEEEASFKVKVAKKVLELLGVPDFAVEFSWDAIVEKALKAFQGFLNKLIFPDFTNPNLSFNKWSEKIAILCFPAIGLAFILFVVRILHYKKTGKGQPPHIVVFLGSLLLFSLFLAANSFVFEFFAVLWKKAIWGIADITGQSFDVTAWDFATLIADMVTPKETSLVGGLLLAVTGPILGLFLMGGSFWLIIQKVFAAPAMAASLNLETKPFGALRVAASILVSFAFLGIAWTLLIVVFLIAASGDISNDKALVLGLGIVLTLVCSLGVTKYINSRVKHKLDAIEQASTAQEQMRAIPVQNDEEMLNNLDAKLK
ncbi:MAG: hypothetical protein FJ044_02320 [Candidatus Cloacimonetes bacterium]|nr:hypothetical protein [Candidatus Cloacimonadota bacterium]